MGVTILIFFKLPIYRKTLTKTATKRLKILKTALTPEDLKTKPLSAGISNGFPVIFVLKKGTNENFNKIF